MRWYEQKGGFLFFGWVATFNSSLECLVHSGRVSEHEVTHRLVLVQARGFAGMATYDGICTCGTKRRRANHGTPTSAKRLCCC
jgi:hypothetical protein